MKIIITEEQFNKIALRRRLVGIMNVGSLIIDNGDDFYDNVDFCRVYPTFTRYIQSLVFNIVQQYEHPIYSVNDVADFIDDLGYKTFVDMLMGEHGNKIKKFYNKKTKNC
jgi:hypothetical protein